MITKFKVLLILESLLTIRMLLTRHLISVDGKLSSEHDLKPLHAIYRLPHPFNFSSLMMGNFSSLMMVKNILSCWRGAGIQKAVTECRDTSWGL